MMMFQDGSGPKQLLGHTHDGLQNANKLRHELSKLHTLLARVSGYKEESLQDACILRLVQFCALAKHKHEVSGLLPI
jgi:hypothetical protein